MRRLIQMNSSVRWWALAALIALGPVLLAAPSQGQAPRKGVMVVDFDDVGRGWSYTRDVVTARVIAKLRDEPTLRVLPREQVQEAPRGSRGGFPRQAEAIPEVAAARADACLPASLPRGPGPPRARRRRGPRRWRRPPPRSAPPARSCAADSCPAVRRGGEGGGGKRAARARGGGRGKAVSHPPGGAGG